MKKWLNGRYEKVEKLGEGTYGVVYKAIDHFPHLQKSFNLPIDVPLGATSSGVDSKVVESIMKGITTSTKLPQTTEETKGDQYVAIKKHRLFEGAERKKLQYLRELKFLQSLQHPNIVKIYDAFILSHNLYFVLEYTPIDLSRLIPKQKLTEGQIKGILKQLLEVLNFVHSKSVLHRDINPANILLTKEGVLKLADFGIARTFPLPGEIMTKSLCARWYKAPETIFGDPAYGPASDMWSVGCVFAELLLREPIFPGTSDISQLTKISEVLGSPNEGNYPGVTSLPNFLPFPECQGVSLAKVVPATEDALDLLTKMLQWDPKKRPTAKEAMTYPYFAKSPLIEPIIQ